MNSLTEMATTTEKPNTRSTFDDDDVKDEDEDHDEDDDDYKQWQ